MKRILERRLREKIGTDGIQFGLMPGKGKTEEIFKVRQLQEKFLMKKKSLFHAFVELKRAFNRVPRKTVCGGH